MPTGFEDYVQYQYTQPATALSKAQQHLTALMQMQGVRTSADGVSYDPATLEAAISSVRDDIRRLATTVHSIGKPRLIPTRRLDPGPIVGQY
jgi:hypothetical protein